MYVTFRARVAMTAVSHQLKVPALGDPLLVFCMKDLFRRWLLFSGGNGADSQVVGSCATFLGQNPENLVRRDVGVDRREWIFLPDFTRDTEGRHSPSVTYQLSAAALIVSSSILLPAREIVQRPGWLL